MYNMHITFILIQYVDMLYEMQNMYICYDYRAETKQHIWNHQPPISHDGDNR